MNAHAFSTHNLAGLDTTHVPVINNGGVHMPWSIWTRGPGGGVIRWLSLHPYVIACFGQRVALMTKEPEEKCSVLYIMDFNPYNVKRTRAVLWSTGESQISLLPLIEKGQTVQRVVESSVNLCPTFYDRESDGELPYVETIVNLNTLYDNMFMDGERIICSTGGKVVVVRV